MPDNNPWLLIINPSAGKGQDRKILTESEAILNKFNIVYKAVYTEKKGHASDLTSDYITQGFRKIIVAGGDGTLNEVINGIFNQQKIKTPDITVAVIPIGTGNDWIRTYNIPRNTEQAASLINKGNSSIQDIGLVTYFEKGERKQRYFINNAGVGFDAYVVEQSNKKKESGSSGSLLYLFYLLRYLINYKNKECKITVDDEMYQGKILSICVGMGKYNGGGMMPIPDSVVDDGLFDVSVFTDIKKSEVVYHLKKLYNGRIYSFKKVKKFQGKKVYIEIENSCCIEADGELLGQGPFTFEIIPKSIRVISC